MARQLAGKEWKLGNNGRFFSLNLKLTTIGGKYLTPIDFAKSQEFGRTIYRNSEAYSERQSSYFRTDLRVALRKNAARLSWKLSLDIQNLTNYENPQRPYYDRWSGTQEFGYNTTIIPVISYTIDF